MDDSRIVFYQVCAAVYTEPLALYHVCLQSVYSFLENPFAVFMCLSSRLSIEL